ncbi:MAG: MarR family winged helix-turn-helix transcriptional regulator [Acidimicrobiales bacterium]
MADPGTTVRRRATGPAVTGAEEPARTDRERERCGGYVDRVTTAGLLFEAASGLRRLVEHRLAVQSGASNQALDVLVRLSRTPGGRLRMSELADQISLTRSGLTRAVDRLEQRGLVERASCPEDGRGAFAVLTPTGARLMSEALPSHAAQLDEVFAGLFTAEEEQTLTTLLRRLRDHVHTVPPDTGPPDTGPPDDPA